MYSRRRRLSSPLGKHKKCRNGDISRLSRSSDSALHPIAVPLSVDVSLIEYEFSKLGIERSISEIESDHKNYLSDSSDTEDSSAGSADTEKDAKPESDTEKDAKTESDTEKDAKPESDTEKDAKPESDTEKDAKTESADTEKEKEVVEFVLRTRNAEHRGSEESSLYKYTADLDPEHKSKLVIKTDVIIKLPIIISDSSTRYPYRKMSEFDKKVILEGKYELGISPHCSEVFKIAQSSDDPLKYQYLVTRYIVGVPRHLLISAKIEDCVDGMLVSKSPEGYLQLEETIVCPNDILYRKYVSKDGAIHRGFYVILNTIREDFTKVVVRKIPCSKEDRNVTLISYTSNGIERYMEILEFENKF